MNLADVNNITPPLPVFPFHLFQQVPLGPLFLGHPGCTRIENAFRERQAALSFNDVRAQSQSCSSCKRN